MGGEYQQHVCGFQRWQYSVLRIVGLGAADIDFTYSKREEDGKKVAICEIWCEDQRGDITAKGMATVELPSRGK